MSLSIMPLVTLCSSQCAVHPHRPISRGCRCVPTADRLLVDAGLACLCAATHASKQIVSWGVQTKMSWRSLLTSQDSR